MQQLLTNDIVQLTMLFCDGLLREAFFLSNRNLFLTEYFDAIKFFGDGERAMP